MYELCQKKQTFSPFDKAKCGVVGVSYTILLLSWREKITALDISYSLDILLVMSKAKRLFSSILYPVFSLHQLFFSFLQHHFRYTTKRKHYLQLDLKLKTNPHVIASYYPFSVFLIFHISNHVVVVQYVQNILTKYIFCVLVAKIFHIYFPHEILCDCLVIAPKNKHHYFSFRNVNSLETALFYNIHPHLLEKCIQER